MKLVTSESHRNIGSVTCFLDPKIFKESLDKKHFATDEIWQQIRDITITPTKDVQSNVSHKVLDNLSTLNSHCFSYLENISR